MSQIQEQSVGNEKDKEQLPSSRHEKGTVFLAPLF